MYLKFGLLPTESHHIGRSVFNPYRARSTWSCGCCLSITIALKTVSALFDIEEVRIASQWTHCWGCAGKFFRDSWGVLKTGLSFACVCFLQLKLFHVIKHDVGRRAFSLVIAFFSISFMLCWGWRSCWCVKKSDFVFTWSRLVNLLMLLYVLT